MKIEARGKYAGVKVHLDGDEAEMFLAFTAKKIGYDEEARVMKFVSKLGGKIQSLIGEIPNLLEDRTEEQILDALQSDASKIEKQLKALKKGGDQWQHVK